MWIFLLLFQNHVNGSKNEAVIGQPVTLEIRPEHPVRQTFNMSAPTPQNYNTPNLVIDPRNKADNRYNKMWWTSFFFYFGGGGGGLFSFFLKSNISVSVNQGLGLGSLCLMSLTTLYQLYHGGKLYWWRRLEDS